MHYYFTRPPILSIMSNSYKKLKFARFFLALSLFLLISGAAFCQSPKTINIIFTSDAHYGITRKDFRGDTNVDSYVVNAAMIKTMNSLPTQTLPVDGGIGAGTPIAAVDYLIQTGDIANRMEPPFQSAAADWAQFEHDYMQSVTLKNHQHQPAPLWVAPGNHDISNAIGYYRTMTPKTDPTSMVKIYNMMLKPSHPKTNADYNYVTDKINYSKDIQGIHIIFITLWPDSAERIWMEKDLAKVAKSTPVMVFCHDQPTCEAKHFTNPVAPYDMTAANKFENLTAEHYKEGSAAVKDDGSTDIEQRGWVKFLKAHRNIKAYFHGNSNWNEFYVYGGPDNDVAINTFRVDSPMKGKYSSKDETKLSYQLITLDAANQSLTVRECLWNTDPSKPTTPVVFGASKTVSLKVE